jgi:general secretion pathway protein D
MTLASLRRLLACLLLPLLLSPAAAQIPAQLFAQIPDQRPPGTVSPNAIQPTIQPGATTQIPNLSPAGSAPSTGGSAPGSSAPGSDFVVIQYPGYDLTEILVDYEEWTGKKVIRDANIEGVKVTIETTGELPKEQAIRYLEASLLLNGYAFVPAGPGLVKILAADAKRPSTEGTDFYTDVAKLPFNEEVVTFIATLKHLNSEDAVKAIDQIVPRHSYGMVQAVENMKALVIIENTATIRAILTVLEQLDKPAQPEIQKSFQLTRADADDVAGALNEILESDEKDSGSGPSGRNPPAVQGGQAPAGQPGQAAPPPGISVGGGGNTPGSTAKPPKIVAIPRTNRIMVIGTEEAVDYIGKLIDELDAPADLRNFVTRRLSYLRVDAAMAIIGDAIHRGNGQSSGGGSGAGGVTGNSTTNTGANTVTNNRGGFGGGFGGGMGGLGGGMGGVGGGFGGVGGGMGGVGGGFGGGMGGFGGGMGGMGGMGGGQPMLQNTAPTSLLVGKTLLIADPINNSIFLSGPPDHLRILDEIIDELDIRPKQIVINVVIGEMNLSDNFEFGIDYLLRPTRFKFDRYSGTGLGVLRNTAAAFVDPNAITNNTELPSGLGGLTTYGSIDEGVDVIVRALAGNRNFEVVSRPTLLTMNNQPADITSGTSIPVPTTSTNSVNPGGDGQFGVTSQIQFQPIVLGLSVTPLINNDNELTLQIMQQNNEQSGSTTINGNPFPNISQQTLNTTVMVRDGSTVLLGGLIRENVEKERNGLPFLKDVPLIKHLVSSVKDNKTRRELLVFIQPRIVSGDGDLPANYQDSTSQTPFGDRMRTFMNHEQTAPAEGVKRSKLGELFYRLTHPRQEERVGEIE